VTGGRIARSKLQRRRHGQRLAKLPAFQPAYGTPGDTKRHARGEFLKLLDLVTSASHS
jgi:hypothetical protein